MIAVHSSFASFAAARRSGIEGLIRQGGKVTRSGVVMLVALAASVPAAAQQSAQPALGEALSAATQPPNCKSDATQVVVCGRADHKYRIDPNVLAATRAAEAPPPKPKLDASKEIACVGPNCGGGDYVPLVGMALTAIKAAELAAQGDDWREAFRTHPDQYRAYQESQESGKPHVNIAITAGSK
jgi:hypothetical protein